MLKVKNEETGEIRESREAEQILRDSLQGYDRAVVGVVEASIAGGNSVKIGKVLVWKD